MKNYITIIAKGQLNGKMEGIRYHWDMINESAGNINDFILQKDTVISNRTYYKVVRRQGEGPNSTVYELLLTREPDVKFDFRPVSPGLSKKYKGMVTHYSIFDRARRVRFKGIWKVQEQLTVSELAKVHHYLV